MPANYLSRLGDDAKDFFRTWGNPEQAYAARAQDVRQYRYARLWDMYQGTAYQDMTAWGPYRRAFGLYRQTRVVWDHVHQLVEFYATHIWSGALADDGLKLPDGVMNAIPLAEDTDEGLAAAIAQLWLWWNFQEVMVLISRYTAAVGELLVEIKDDPSRGKVMIELVWPAYIKEVRLDEAGNVKYYCIEYRVKEKGGTQFTYRREVDSESFRTYKDGKPYDFIKNPLPETTEPFGAAPMGMDQPKDGPLTLVNNDYEDGSSIDNPYGFAPAVWFRHFRVLGTRGEPAVWATQAEFDEINQLFAHMLDKAHISLEAPIVVAGNIAPNALQKALQSMVGAVKRPFTEDLDNPRGDGESLNILEGPAGTRVETIELKISEAAEALDRIIASIERKCPEITFYSKLREMTQLTGPAAAPIIGDVARKVRAIASGYDRQLIKLLQMSVAICGMRFDEGLEGWAEKTEEQKKFAEFGLESFLKGDLNFNIMPRDLVPLTVKDRLELAQLKKTVLDIIPQVQLAKEIGYDAEEAEKWQTEFEEKQEEQLQMAHDQAIDLAQTSGAFKKPSGAPGGGPQRGSKNQRSGGNRTRPRPKN